MHYHIVGLEEIHVPYPNFTVQHPHTSTKTSYVRTAPEQITGRVGDATIIITTTVKITAEILREDVTPALQAVAVMASGTDCVDIEAAKERGIKVFNCPHAPTEVVSDHAIGQYFAARRKTVLMHEITVQEPSEWKEKGSVVSHLRDPQGNAPLSTSEEVMGIIGYGAIGQRISTMAKALGMAVLVADRKNGDPATAKGDRVPFVEVLKGSTVLMLTLPRTKDTLKLLSCPELAIINPHSVIINVSRGGIVNEDAIVHALLEGKIAGYATDVFATEPAEGATDSLLLSPKAKGLNITLSPHVAWFGEKTRQNLQRTLRENIETFMAGSPQNLVF